MRKLSIYITLIVAFLFAWQWLASRSSNIAFFVSTPSSCIRYAFAHQEILVSATAATAIETISGFLFAALVTGLLMIVCLYYPTILKAVLPAFVASQILPMITLAPLFIVLFGMGLLSKIAMVVLMCFFPIFINFAAGVRNIPAEVGELLYLYDTRRTFRIFFVMIPLALPSIFVGLRVSTTMAVMGAIVAEFMGARDGLGKNLYLAPKSSEPQLMMCSIALVVILGFVFYSAVSILEKRICKWNP